MNRYTCYEGIESNSKNINSSKSVLNPDTTENLNGGVRPSMKYRLKRPIDGRWSGGNFTADNTNQSLSNSDSMKCRPNQPSNKPTSKCSTHVSSRLYNNPSSQISNRGEQQEGYTTSMQNQRNSIPIRKLHKRITFDEEDDGNDDNKNKGFQGQTEEWPSHNQGRLSLPALPKVVTKLYHNHDVNESRNDSSRVASFRTSRSCVANDSNKTKAQNRLRALQLRLSDQSSRNPERSVSSTILHANTETSNTSMAPMVATVKNSNANTTYYKAIVDKSKDGLKVRRKRVAEDNHISSVKRSRQDSSDSSRPTLDQTQESNDEPDSQKISFNKHLKPRLKPRLSGTTLEGRNGPGLKKITSDKRPKLRIKSIQSVLEQQKPSSSTPANDRLAKIKEKLKQQPIKQSPSSKAAMSSNGTLDTKQPTMTNVNNLHEETVPNEAWGSASAAQSDLRVSSRSLVKPSSRPYSRIAAPSCSKSGSSTSSRGSESSASPHRSTPSNGMLNEPGGFNIPFQHQGGNPTYISFSNDQQASLPESKKHMFLQEIDVPQNNSPNNTLMSSFSRFNPSQVQFSNMMNFPTIGSPQPMFPMNGILAQPMSTNSPQPSPNNTMTLQPVSTSYMNFSTHTLSRNSQVNTPTTVVSRSRTSVVNKPRKSLTVAKFHENQREELVTPTLTFKCENENVSLEDGIMDWEASPMEVQEALDAAQLVRKEVPVKAPLDNRIPWFIVVDTNILLIHLKFVKHLRDNDFEDGSPILIIPWIVLQELDTLKEKTVKKPFLNAQARQATRWVNENLTKGHPRIKGDILFGEISQNIRVMYNDDYILSSCWNLRKHARKVTLLTDDVNLRNKAHLLNIVPTSKDDLARNLKTVAKVDDSYKKTASLDHCFNTDQPLKILQKLNKILTDVLGMLLEVEMTKCYQQDWEQVIIRKYPWKIGDIFFNYLHHWVAVFGSTYSATVKRHLEELEKFFKAHNSKAVKVTRKEVSEGIEMALNLLQRLPVHGDGQLVPPRILELQKLLAMCQESAQVRTSHSVSATTLSNATLPRQPGPQSPAPCCSPRQTGEPKMFPPPESSIVNSTHPQSPYAPEVSGSPVNLEAMDEGDREVASIDLVVDFMKQIWYQLKELCGTACHILDVNHQVREYVGKPRDNGLLPSLNQLKAAVDKHRKLLQDLITSIEALLQYPVYVLDHKHPACCAFCTAIVAFGLKYVEDYVTIENVTALCKNDSARETLKQALSEFAGFEDCFLLLEDSMRIQGVKALHGNSSDFQMS